MKTVNLPMYGKIEVCVKYCVVCLKIDYTLQCLEYICSISSVTIKTPWALNREDTDKCTLTITKKLKCTLVVNKCCYWCCPFL